MLNPWDIGARKIWRPLSAPNMNERPLVLAIHLSPSLPIEIFEVFAEIIEVVTKKPVVLLYETRFGRPVAKDITDIGNREESYDSIKNRKQCFVQRLLGDF